MKLKNHPFPNLNPQTLPKPHYYNMLNSPISITFLLPLIVSYSMSNDVYKGKDKHKTMDTRERDRYPVHQLSNFGV